MVRTYSVTDQDQCRSLWEENMPKRVVTDLWPVRDCFHGRFGRDSNFIVAEESGKVVGLIPMSWIPESRCYAFFPGETWHGKTWLEQNRIIARDRGVLDGMLGCLDGSGADYHLRYLLPPHHGFSAAVSDRENCDKLAAVPVLAACEDCPKECLLDETGYLFHGAQHGYDFDRYFGSFSGKRAKKIRREMEGLESRDLAVRRGGRDDFETLVGMNIERYGNDSYFADERFAGGFRDLMNLLDDRGWMRMTVVTVEGVPAAVDLGCVYEGAYTLLAGGTDARFPGIAKYINLHHIRTACGERFESVDFLCGEFAWKDTFHLTARPLFKLTNMDEALLGSFGADGARRPGAGDPAEGARS
jgi:hypothetical protein